MTQDIFAYYFGLLSMLGFIYIAMRAISGFYEYCEREETVKPINKKSENE